MLWVPQKRVGDGQTGGLEAGHQSRTCEDSRPYPSTGDNTPRTEEVGK